MWPQEKKLYVIKIIKRSFRIVMCPNANGTNFRGITSHSSAKDLQTRKSRKKQTSLAAQGVQVQVSSLVVSDHFGAVFV